jgi:integrase
MVPAPLDGRHGTFRAAGPNSLGAETDLQAIRHWLRRFKDSPRTAASYERIVERFYLWCVLCRRKPLSSLVEADFSAYLDFLADPPADWVQQRQMRRAERDWRPLKGPLSASSRKLDFSVIGSLFSTLVQAGYLSANALAGIRPSMKLPHVRINVERRLSDAQWRWILRCWDTLYSTCGPGGQPEVGRISFPSMDNPDQDAARASALRRTRLVLELGAATGLRLNELATTRMAALSEHVIDGSAVLLLTVRGLRGKVREVPVPSPIKALIDQHHRDVCQLAVVRDRLRVRKSGGGSQASALVPLQGQEAVDWRPDAGDATTERGRLPLINPLRPPPPRWSTDARGVATLSAPSTDTEPRGGLVDATALYQSLKRFFRRCSLEARHQANAVELAGIEVASTHWLRHFFASAAAADGVDLVVLRDVLGHVSLQTTSVYVRPERKRLVEGLAQLRRRD